MALLDRFRRNKLEREYEEFRGAAVGEYPPPPAQGFGVPARAPTGPRFPDRIERLGAERGPAAQAQARGFEEASRLPDITREEPMPEIPSYGGPTFRKENEPTDKFDILQRLDMIEATLSAIRAQTETINERLKTLDMKMSQRQPARTGYF